MNFICIDFGEMQDFETSICQKIHKLGEKEDWLKFTALDAKWQSGQFTDWDYFNQAGVENDDIERQLRQVW